MAVIKITITEETTSTWELSEKQLANTKLPLNPNEINTVDPDEVFLQLEELPLKEFSVDERSIIAHYT